MESNIKTMEESNGIKYFDTWRNQMESNKNEWRNQMESNILTHGGIKWNQIKNKYFDNGGIKWNQIF